MRLEAAGRRTLLVGATAIAGILFVGRGLPTLQRWESLAVSRSTVAQAELQRARRILSLAASVDSATTATRLEEVQNLMFRGETPSAAAIRLTSALQDFARHTGLEISASSVRADTAFSSEFAAISTRLVATAEIRQLTSWLAKLERHSPLMSVELFVLTSPEPAATEGELLRVDIVVSGVAYRDTLPGGRER